MLNKLTEFNRSAWFWVALIVLCIAMEGAALFYQYVLEYAPCTLCVHVRAWVMAMMIAAVIGLFLRRSRFGLVLANLLTLGAVIGFLERSYMTLGTERGWVDGSCGDLSDGYPAWLPLDKLLPAVFQPLESCGLTPWVIPQFMSMAEALILLAAGLFVAMVIIALNSVRAALSR
jgi:disulfide bond formation protein DsbB